MARALITDAGFRQALTVMRSLGKQGIFTAAVADIEERNIDTLGFHSKYCNLKFLIPSYRKSVDVFIERLLEIVRDFDVLIPISTQAIIAVASHLREFEEVTSLAIPDLQTINAANCKDRLLKLANTLGIPIPNTIYLEDLSQIAPLSEKLSYPVIIKYRSDQNLYLSPAERYAIVHSNIEFIDVYEKMHKVQPFPLIQEYIYGQGYGLFALFDKNHQPKAIFCHKRIREYPITGGVSSCCISIRDEQLIDYGLKLLKALNWCGVAMVEFKKDIRDGQFKLMEINPRFWGSSPLAIECQVDFPHLLFKAAKGEDFPSVMTYKQGVKMRFLCLDLLAAKDTLLMRNQKMFFLYNFIRDLLDLKIKDGIFSFNDPWPGIVYLRKYLPIYFLRTLRRHGSI